MQCAPYQILASIYDQDWGNFILAYLPFINWLGSRIGFQGKKILDAACGTGNLARILCRQGSEVVGFDRSAAMLKIAASRCAQLPACFWQSDMREFATRAAYFDIAFNTFDAINYLLTTAEIALFLERIHFGLKWGGFFIFDINTPNAFRQHPHGRFSRQVGAVRFQSQQDFDAQPCLERTRLFFPEGEEEHVQRGYSKSEIETLLHQQRFKIINGFTAFQFSPADDTTERLLYLTQTI
ncbi:class I SAM-dependent methyltransferase [candidate division KSB1 bacterium]|nr:class I SAM-dependent methyltransferase [candidate division KSB1 bacterium]